MKSISVVTTMSVFAVIVFGTNLRAEDAGVEKLNKALKRKVTFEILDMKFSDAIEHVAKMADLKVTWSDALPADAKTLPITIKVKDMESKTAISWLAKLAEVDFLVVGDHVEMTTAALAEAGRKKDAK